jgi:hypothetical protein
MAEALLRNLRFALQSKPTESRGELVPLSSMSLQELRVLAEAVVAPDRQQQLQSLLDKNRRGELSPEEQKTLDKLLTEVDQVALLKARARYTMSLYLSWICRKSNECLHPCPVTQTSDRQCRWSLCLLPKQAGLNGSYFCSTSRLLGSVGFASTQLIRYPNTS